MRIKIIAAALAAVCLALTACSSSDSSSQTGTPDIGASYNTVIFTTIMANREQAPDSEISDISCEETELDNGAFGE